jgi:TnpA family transposase
LKQELAGMLPFAPIASLLIELDHGTGFLGCFTHAGGHKQAQLTELKRNILAVLIANATMSSSDGQRFPVRGKSLTARAMNVHFADQGLSTYTHVSDQHSTFGTKVIVPTTREAHYVLDDFLGNATDLRSGNTRRTRTG